jgi:16S rRNA G966 N2-methylase RsmD
LILLDPPYKLKPYQEVLELIASRQLLNNHGIIVMESDHQTSMTGVNDIQIIKEKTLGQSKITILERNKL